MSIQRHTQIEKTLDALHEDAKKDYLRIGKGIVKSAFRPIKPQDFANVYLPISRSQGHNLKQLVIDNNCKNIIEFGTSFGISTIYLAAGAQQTNGKVISTELIASKADRAQKNINDAGVQDFVNIKIGDAMETLKTNSDPIDFLFLDGWKDLYLPLFQMLETNFHKGTIIYADNMDMRGTEAYANYILGKKENYSTQSVDEGKGFLTIAR